MRDRYDGKFIGLIVEWIVVGGEWLGVFRFEFSEVFWVGFVYWVLGVWVG